MTRIRFALVVLFFPLALHAEDARSVNFSSKKGKFSVVLSAKPIEKSSKVKINKKRDGDLHIFAVPQKDKSSAQVITYSDYLTDEIGADRDKFLATVVERNVLKLNGSLVSDVKITIGKQKAPGRDIRIDQAAKKRIYRAKFFLVGNRLYQVVALGSAEFIKSKPVEEYFKSFAIEE